MHDIEQAFGRQLVFELVEGAAQGAVTGFFQMFDDELELAAALVQRDPSPRQHLHAIIRFEAQQLITHLEHGAAHLRLLVFEREIQMPGAGPGQIGQLAFHPDQREMALQDGARLLIEA